MKLRGYYENAGGSYHIYCPLQDTMRSLADSATQTAPETTAHDTTDMGATRYCLFSYFSIDTGSDFY